MSAHSLPRRSAPGRPGHQHLLAPRLALRARSQASSLDRHLAAGVPSWRTPLHPRRALQLTGHRPRRSLAKSRDEARRPYRLTKRHAGILPARAAVRHSAELIESRAATLYGDAPSNAMWVARLRVLLSDGAGPLYVDGHSVELHHRLAEINARMVAGD